VHDDNVVVAEAALRAVRLSYLPVQPDALGLKLESFTVEAVVNVLRKREKCRRAVDDQPIRRDPDVVHQRREARQNLGDPAALARGIDVENLEAA